MLRDVGGLVYEFHRAGAGSAPGEPGAPLVSHKLDRLTALDEERRALEAALDDRRAETVLREPGVGGVCPACGEYFASDARFCSRCGARVDGRVHAENDSSRDETAGVPAQGAASAVAQAGASARTVKGPDREPPAVHPRGSRNRGSTGRRPVPASDGPHLPALRRAPARGSGVVPELRHRREDPGRRGLGLARPGGHRRRPARDRPHRSGGGLPGGVERSGRRGPGPRAHRRAADRSPGPDPRAARAHAGARPHHSRNHPGGVGR
jgi:hypothetical protein